MELKRHKSMKPDEMHPKVLRVDAVANPVSILFENDGQVKYQ